MDGRTVVCDVAGVCSLCGCVGGQGECSRYSSVVEHLIADQKVKGLNPPVNCFGVC